MTRRQLILFVKAPRLGSVKTRLARDIGRYEAWRFYRDTTRLMLVRLSRHPDWAVTLAVTPDHFARRARFWPAGFPRMPQGPGNIGDRMARAFRNVPPGPAVLIGADIPMITADHITRAFERLSRADLVFGPSTDGGFWLVGVNRASLMRGVFRHVRWSTPDALSDTLVNTAGRRVALLDPLTDIDTGEDYYAWKTGRMG